MSARPYARCSLSLCLVASLALAGCDSPPPEVKASPNRRDGTAIMLVIDVSGSMQDSVRNAAGRQEQKLAIARRAAIQVAEKVNAFAREDSSRNIQMGVASFSDNFTLLLPLQSPNVPAATAAISRMAPSGSTAIGDSVLAAQRLLDASGLKRQHILIVTDGENTSGTTPEAAALALNSLPVELRPSLWVIAFDVNAGVFSKVKAQGWEVFSAANGAELESRLDEVITGHVLIEK